MKMGKRAVSLVLCLSMLFSMAVHSIPTVMASEKFVKITSEGQVVESLTIEQTDKKTVSAVTGGLDAPSFQWQILLDPQSSVWVNIYDRTEQNCEVSYALVKNMLDDADSTYIRCTATAGGETVYSDEVCVTVSPEQESVPQVTALTRPECATAEDTVTNIPAAFSMARSTATEYVTITVKYLDIDSLHGAEAAIYSPYTATIVSGTAFNQSVVSPTFLGFAPYLDSNGNGDIDDDDDSAATLSLVYKPEETTEDIEIKVYYKPIKVNFAVKYFFQNINDDLYTEDAARYRTDKAETGTIVTNEDLESHAGDTTGFTKMYHIPESVAADGSTVFECYYDRNYYLIQFDLNGGYGVDPIYARYGTPFIVNDPIRHGYTFDGWRLTHIDTDGNGEWDDTLPVDVSTELVSTIPSYNYRYQATWKNVDTTYTVVYWLGENYIGSRVVSAKSGSLVSGTDDLGSTLGIDTTYSVYEKADTNVLVEGDGSTVVNVYYQPKQYTLRFYYAATTGTGTDADGDGIAEAYDSVKIIGGSTYSFGKNGTNTSDDEALLNGIFATSNAGTVKTLPQLNAEGKSRPYTFGTLVSGDTSYHYIEFTAGYGQDISGLWPCAVFESVTRATSNTHTNWNGTEAFLSAWNGEHHVWYSQNKSNQTIKGKYEKLDYALLFDSRFEDETTVSYLCFWENGANIGWSVPELYVYKIWIPVLAGEGTGDAETCVRNGITYVLKDSYDTCDDSNVNQQTQPSLDGYTPDGYDSSVAEYDTTLYSEGYVVNFYYKRENESFAMKDYGKYLVNIETDATGNGGVSYGTPLSSLSELSAKLDESYNPPYPSTLEENAYYFDGWYTTEQCLPGTKVDIASATMPASGLILYANWVPQTHTARFFTTYDEMTAFENHTSSTLYASHDVKHGDIVGKAVSTPVRTGDGTLDFTFSGWFYMENGQKKAFSPLNMPVNRDINVFAEWSSHSPQPYRIRYVLRSDPDISVADDTTGFAYGGSTRTFSAKAGDPYNQLYDAYNKGYFPTLSSHSITIQAEADKDDPVHNVHTFYYVEAAEITYTVRYVNKETNVVMKTVKKTTSSAVVTERFLAYENMVPDAFYKRLVLEVEEDENGNWVGTEDNVVTFYYTPNDTNAYYAVHFMLEKLDATDAERSDYDINGNGGYQESGTYIEGVGIIGSTVYITPQEISGFSLIQDGKVPLTVLWNATQSDAAQSVANYSDANNGYGITVTQNGTELYLFYKRNKYPYQVHYYEYNTTTPVAHTADKVDTAYFGSTVTEDAKKIAGYTCVSEQTQTITIREDDGTKGLNVIIFYYAPIKYTVEYVAVPENGGMLSKTIEVIFGSGTLEGSVPTAKPYYDFDGWYLDEACTKPVTEEYGTVDAENRFTPYKAKLSETKRNIFYAKLVKKVGDLTVKRTGATNDGQVFVYEIKGRDTGTVIYVTVTGNSSVTVRDLPLGEYTVTQQNDWSWRYTDEVSAVSHQNADGTTVLFGKAEQKTQWLNGNSNVKRNRRG